MAIKDTYLIKMPLALSVFVTLFLFYIDEGYYNFKWMLNIGNWLIFVLYVFILFMAQILVMKAVLYKSKNPIVMGFKYMVGIALGIAVAFWVFTSTN